MKISDLKKTRPVVAPEPTQEPCKCGECIECTRKIRDAAIKFLLKVDLIMGSPLVLTIFNVAAVNGAIYPKTAPQYMNERRDLLTALGIGGRSGNDDEDHGQPPEPEGDRDEDS